MESQSLTIDVSVLEKQLVEYYINSALSTNDANHININLDKSIALNHTHAFLTLARHFKRIKKHDSAVGWYIKALEDGSCNPEAEDCLLRHGTFEQYNGYVSSMHNQQKTNNYYKFILDTITYYRQTVDGLVADVKQASSNTKSKLVVNISYWGERYVDIFLKYLLSILMSDKNLPYASSVYEIHFVVATTENEFFKFSQHHLFNKLREHAHIHFVKIPTDLLAYSIDYSIKQGGNWTIPITYLTNAEHYAAIESARILGADIITLWPDHIVSDSFLFDLVNCSGQFSVVSGLTFRLKYENTILSEIDRHRKSDGIINIPYQSMFLLLNHFLPEQNFYDAAQFSTFPIYLCFRVGKEGIIATANHYSPWLIRSHHLTGPVYPSLDPVDGFFIDKHLANKANLVLAPEKVIVFDLGNNPLVSLLDGSAFSIDKVAEWLQPWLTDVHEKYFRNCMRYPVIENCDAAEWGNTSAMAERSVQTIIAKAKNAAR